MSDEDGAYADAIQSLVSAVKEAEAAKRKHQAAAQKWALAIEQMCAILDAD